MTELQSSIDAADERAANSHRPQAAAASSEHWSEPANSPQAAKFRAITGGLIGLAVAAVVVAVVVAAAGRGGPSGSSAPWSSWAPSESGNLGARDIADHIAPTYRLSAVNQLAVVTVVNLTQQSSATAAASSAPTTTPTGLQVAVRPDPTSTAVSLLPGKTIAFNLCGVASQNCSIGIGTPSSARLLLLRREALELALYTFKYISGTDNVVAILPPGRAQQTSALTKSPPPAASSTSTTKPIDVAVLFSRPELSFLLKQPLAAALPEQAPPLVSQMTSAPEAGLVAQVTANGLFSERLEQAQDGSSLIVLDPLPPQ
jgi:hypothetical protein